MYSHTVAVDGGDKAAVAAKDKLKKSLTPTKLVQAEKYAADYEAKYARTAMQLEEEEMRKAR